MAYRLIRWTHQRITRVAHTAIGRLAKRWRIPRSAVIEQLALIAEELMQAPQWHIIFIGDQPVSMALGSSPESLVDITRQQMLGQKIDGPITARLADDVPFEQFCRIAILATFQLLTTQMMAANNRGKPVRLT